METSFVESRAQAREPYHNETTLRPSSAAFLFGGHQFKNVRKKIPVKTTSKRRRESRYEQRPKVKNLLTVLKSLPKMSREDAEQMEKAIEEACEKIDLDSWYSDFPI